MKKKSLSKIFSAFAVLAISAGAACAIPFAGCSKKAADNNLNGVGGSYKQITVDTALGKTVSRTNGKILFVSKDAPKNDTTNCDGTLEKPYHVQTVLDIATAADSANVKVDPGTTIALLPGEYTGLTDSLHFRQSGAYNAYIEIRPATLADGISQEQADANGGKVLLNFREMALNGSNRGIQLYSNYIYWHDIDVCGAGDNGIFVAGKYNTVENCDLYNNRDTGLQIGREAEIMTNINQWPAYNLIKNCTSHNNYDNGNTFGENADGFAAKLSIGYGNVFDGCIAYRNADDGWDLFAYVSNGNIGTVLIQNCVAYENGFLETTRDEFNDFIKNNDFTSVDIEAAKSGGYVTSKGDGNGFKLGGSVMEGDVVLDNCMTFNNRMHGVTDNSNPGFLNITNVTAYDNSATINAKTGKVIASSANSSHANVDVKRHSYSYNNLNGVLSVKNISSGLQADAYRGSVANSIVYRGENTYGKFEDSVVSFESSVKSFSAPSVSNIFEMLPINGSTYNVDGTTDSAHTTFRNAADGSINMGNILKVKDQSALLGKTRPVGADLSKTSWEDYDHFYDNVLVDDTQGSETMAKLKRAAEALTINCDPDAVYQPFDVVNKMHDCDITWKSSDETVAVPGTEVDNSAVSGAEFIVIDVFRSPDGDKTATLTATISLDGQELEKTFTITVKKGDSVIGAVSVVTPKGEILGDGESTSTIVDRFDVYKEPTVQVRDALYPDQVKYLNPDQYTYTVKYQYQTDASMDPITVKGFTPSNAGIFTISVVATLKSDNSTSKMTYRIFVASEYAQADFNGKSDVSVYQDGFIISGEPGSATGILYAVASKDNLNITDAKDIVNQSGVQAYPYRATNLSVKFNMTNNAAYNVYYAIANASGEVTSKLYKSTIGAVEISTADNLKKIADGGNIKGEDPTKTIYLLTQDINGGSLGGGSKTFKGLLNGQGHTVSNITVSQSSKGKASLFYNVTGGTIMNIKFKNISLTNTSDNVGIVGSCNGGYFKNIELSQVVTKGRQCTSGLIGIILPASLPTYISQVYVDNTCKMTGTDTRTSAIVGRIYRETMAGTAEVYISDCLVSAKIEGTGTGVGGFVGEMDAQGDVSSKASDWYLEFNNCVFNGEAYGKADTYKTAGLLGDQKNLCTVRVNNCLSIGKIYYNFKNGDNVEKTERIEANKNSSGLIGGYVATADISVRNSGALFEEYNSSISNNVTVYDDYTLQNNGRNVLLNIMSFDESKWTLVYDSTGATTSGGVQKLESPYLTLKYLEA